MVLFKGEKRNGAAQSQGFAMPHSEGRRFRRLALPGMKPSCREGFRSNGRRPLRFDADRRLDEWNVDVADGSTFPCVLFPSNVVYNSGLCGLKALPAARRAGARRRNPLFGGLSG